MTEDAKPKTKEAYYSKEMDDRYGHVFWLDEDGNELKVTCVGIRPSWPDTEFVGNVTRYVSGKLKNTMRVNP